MKFPARPPHRRRPAGTRLQALKLLAAVFCSSFALASAGAAVFVKPVAGAPAAGSAAPLTLTTILTAAKTVGAPLSEAKTQTYAFASSLWKKTVALFCVAPGAAAPISPVPEWLKLFFENFTVCLVAAYGLLLLSLLGCQLLPRLSGPAGKNPAFPLSALTRLTLSGTLLFLPLLIAAGNGLIGGFFTGLTCGRLSTSLLRNLLLFLPHGLPETAGILLACALPLSLWLRLQKPCASGRRGNVQKLLRLQLARGRAARPVLLVAFLLLIAALTESIFTWKLLSILNTLSVGKLLTVHQ